MSEVYVGPIQHDPEMCRPDRCPGEWGCWCFACERGVHVSLEQFRRMTPSEVNRFAASRGMSARVRDDDVSPKPCPKCGGFQFNPPHSHQEIGCPERSAFKEREVRRGRTEPPCREDEAYAAGRLAGFEEGLERGLAARTDDELALYPEGRPPLSPDGAPADTSRPRAS